MRLRYYVLGIALVSFGAWTLVSAGTQNRTDLAHGAGLIVSGIGTLVVATRGIGAMRTWGKILGAAFAALAVASFAIDRDAMAWAHIGVALVFLYQALLAPPTL